MDKTEKTITFDNLPQAVATLLQEVRELRTLTENHTTYGGFSPWMDVDELCEYLPGHPAVLMENLFMDNPADCAFLLSPEGQQAFVDLHVDGIISHLDSL